MAWGAAVAFGLSAGVLWHALRQGEKGQFRLGSALLTLGGILALGYMTWVSVRVGAFPIITPWIGASFLSLLLAFFAVVAWMRYREPAFLAGAAPLATLFACIASLRPVQAEDLEVLANRLSAIRPDFPGIGKVILTSTWFPVHVTLAMSAYALFALAAAMGILQLSLQKQLKAKKGGKPLLFLPPLPVVEHAGILAAFTGIVLLLIALVLGGAGAWVYLRTHLLGDPKEISGAAVFTLYAGIEVLRMLQGWSGRRTALAHVGAFVILISIFLGSSILGPKAHGN